jgi:hypothetical protein
VFAPAQEQNGHNSNHWYHVYNLNAQIEINYNLFSARLRRDVADRFPADVFPGWCDETRCDLADRTGVNARIDHLIGPEHISLILPEVAFSPKDRERLIDILLLFSRLFPPAAKFTDLCYSCI